MNFRWYEDDLENGVRALRIGRGSAVCNPEDFEGCRVPRHFLTSGSSPFLPFTDMEAAQRNKGRLDHNTSLLFCNTGEEAVAQREDEEFRRFCPHHQVWYTPWWIQRHMFAAIEPYRGSPNSLTRVRPGFGVLDYNPGDKSWWVGDPRILLLARNLQTGRLLRETREWEGWKIWKEKNLRGP